MSTPNFKTMEDFPLVCGGMFSEYVDAYEREFEGEDEDVKRDCICDEIQFDADVYANDAEKFSDDLKYYDVSLADGYYDGWQFIVKPKDDFDEDAFHKDSKWCIDNDDAHYWFDECRSKVLREAERERRKINKWLDSKAQNAFMHKLECVAIFSNGEAIYEEAR